MCSKIEYVSIEQANNYKVPDWLGEEVTNLDILANAYMATQAKNISEYMDFIPTVEEYQSKVKNIKNGIY